MRFRPCIDLHNGKVKQIVGSTLTDSSAPPGAKGEGATVVNFESNQPASFFAALYRDDGLRGGHVIMLGPGNVHAAQEALRTFPGGFQVGGGITPDNARSFLDEGASHVIVTSYIFSNLPGNVQWGRLEMLEKAVGKRHIVLDLSCRKIDEQYVIMCDRWQSRSGIILNKKIFAELADHCDEFLVHAVDVEGKQEGIDADLVRMLADFALLPTTYAGGIRSLDDLENIRIVGKNSIDATIGSALDIFGGTLSYRDVVAWHRREQVEKA